MKSVWVRRWEHKSRLVICPTSSVCVRSSIHPSEGSGVKPSNPSLVPCPDWLTGRETKETAANNSCTNRPVHRFWKVCLFFPFFPVSSHLWNSAGFVSHCCCSVFKPTFFCTWQRPSVHPTICPSVVPALDYSSESATFTCQSVTCSIISLSREGGDRHCRKLIGWRTRTNHSFIKYLKDWGKARER